MASLEVRQFTSLCVLREIESVRADCHGASWTRFGRGGNHSCEWTVRLDLLGAKDRLTIWKTVDGERKLVENGCHYAVYKII